MSAPLSATLVVLLPLLLAACGGRDTDAPDPGTAPATPPARGSLIQAPPPRTASLSSAEVLGLLSADSAGQQLLSLIDAPKCGIDIHRLQYNTVDPLGTATTASGAMMIPTGSDLACQGPRPLLLYAHGTQIERAYDIANLTAAGNPEGPLIAVVFAAQGYIVVAPNYAGFDISTLPYHPYLNADQQSKDTADALSAARSALPTSFAASVTDSGKLFITGYSQGGYVALATHRLLQQTGATVTASAPMSGPYALAAFADAVFYGNVVRTAPLFFTYAVTGYQRAYGNLYPNPTDLFEARYASGIEELLPTAGTRSQLFAEGKLPRDQLFSSTPPDPSYAAYTPATAPANLAPVFARGFGPEHLISNAFRLSYLQDAQAHPDGGYPSLSDGRPAANPAHTLRQALQRNDLRDWTPTAPVLLCGGSEDPTVLYLNTRLMQEYWSANAVSAPITELDLESDVSPDDPQAARKAGFAAAKAAVAQAALAGGAADGGAAAVAEAYHSTLVPPFCLSAVESFFDGL